MAAEHPKRYILCVKATRANHVFFKASLVQTGSDDPPPTFNTWPMAKAFSTQWDPALRRGTTWTENVHATVAAALLAAQAAYKSIPPSERRSGLGAEVIYVAADLDRQTIAPWNGV